jgi:hypothetical protein
MFGVELLNPDESFDESFNSLVVVEEYIYPDGPYYVGSSANTSIMHPVNLNSGDYIFAKPISETPSNYKIEVGEWNYNPGDGSGDPAYITCTTGTYPSILIKAMKVIVARPSKSLNRSISGNGMEIRDSFGNVIVNSNEKYIHFGNMGSGFGAMTPDQYTSYTKDTYISIDAMLKSYHAVDGGYGALGDAFYYNFCPIFNTDGITLKRASVVRFAGWAYPESATGHWMTVVIK